MKEKTLEKLIVEGFKTQDKKIAKGFEEQDKRFDAQDKKIAKGFEAQDKKISDWTSVSSMWLNDEDRESGRVPEKPFSINNDHSPKKIRFFPTQQVEKWRADNEAERREFEESKESKRQQGITEEKDNN